MQIQTTPIRACGSRPTGRASWVIPELMPSRDRLRDHNRHGSSSKQTTPQSRPVALHLLSTQTICSPLYPLCRPRFQQKSLAAVGLRHTASANIGGYPDCGNDRSPDMSHVCHRTPMPFLASNQSSVFDKGAHELPRGLASGWLGHRFSRRSTIDTMHRLSQLIFLVRRCKQRACVVQRGAAGGHARLLQDITACTK